MKTSLLKQTAFAIATLILPWTTVAEEPLQLTLDRSEATSTRFDFEEPRLGGFERRQFSKDIRMRGWQVSNSLYFGQSKVARKWGVGFTYENGDTIYGINNRGIQVMKRF